MKSKIHKTKYLQNKNVFEKNFNNKHKNNEWQITVIFYAALHLVEGTFPADMRTENHSERRKLIDNLAMANSNYSNIKIPYRKLYDYSINARYLDIRILDKDIVQAKKYLCTIEENVKWD